MQMPSLPGRSKENASENDDKNQVQIQGVQRNTELGVNLGEEWREWETTITTLSSAEKT